MALRKGDLVKWISHHDSFEASPMGVRGISPVYRHGIIMEVSNKKTSAIIVHCYDCPQQTLVILDTEYDSVVLLSESDNG